MTTMVYFDTLHYVKTLKKAGVSEEQAEAFAQAQQESFSECLDTTLATKVDFQTLDGRIQTLEQRVRMIEWLLGFITAGVGSLVIKAFFG